MGNKDTATPQMHTQKRAMGYARRLVPDWALSNRLGAFALIGAGAYAFFSTWILMSPLVEDVERNVLIAMVVANIIVATSFVILVGARLWHVLSERRDQLAGSRTHLQLVGLFSLLAVIPAVIAFLFAFTILRTSLNDVFSERIDKYQNTARELARGLIDTRAAQHVQSMREIAYDISRQEEEGAGFEQGPISFQQYLQLQAQVRGLSALYLLDGNMRILVRAEIQPGEYNLPAAQNIDEVRGGAFPGEVVFFGVNDDTTFDMFVGALGLDYYDGGVLIAYRPIEPQTTARIIAAREVVADWEEARNGRAQLERVFLAGYIILAVIILFGAIWLALLAATRFVQPIGRLVNMANRVSSGELSARVEVHKEDGELGMLARAMNHMTGQLQTQRNDLIDTNRQFDERRRFTEAVLSGVSAGVIGLSANGRIAIANKSAIELLGEDANRLVGRNLSNVVPELARLLERARSGPVGESGDQIELTRRGRRRALNVRIVKDVIEGEQRFVMTFDDITQLIAAQRNAAWGDVARRIAHEIKNPLTPIQLSAERLRRKYGKEITTAPEVFDNCTETIIRQVSDIGRMVDEFSSFARMPKPVINREDLRELIKSAVFPQKVAFADIAFNVEIPDAPALVDCDGRLIVQALSNLLKNAGESIGARRASHEDGPPGEILVRLETDKNRSKIHIIDNGVGLPAADRHRLTEPYMTTRVKGTGLGLAIVKKVAEEHGGALEYDDARELGPTGARLTFILPQVDSGALLETERTAAE